MALASFSLQEGPSSMALDSDNASVESSFAAFANVLQASKDLDVASRLDQHRGTALLFADICAQRAQLALDDAGYVKPTETLDDDSRQSWVLEQNTWTLIHLLTSERLQRKSIADGGMDQDEEQELALDLYETPLVAIQSILEKDPHLNELKIVREWLQDTLPAKHVVEVRKGYLTFTKNRVRAEKRAKLGGAAGATRYGSAAASGFGPKNRGKVVKELDPDATTRSDAGIELEDATYEKALLRNLFEYVRAGKLDLALDLCRQTDQSWRAATLRGAMLYHDPSISPAIEEIDTPIGNRNRTLWKAVSRKLSANPNLDDYERALYGSLAGELSSVLHVSQTWEEHLWAHINSKFETLIDDRLNESKGWWSQDPDPDSFGDADCGAVKLVEPNASSKETGSLESIFDKLAQTQAHNIHTQAGDPFHVVQRSVICNNLHDLLNRLAGKVGDMQASLEPSVYAGIMRFFSHLILYLRLLQQPLPDVACNEILSAYVQVLEMAGEDALVAMYASSLEPQSATVSYAAFLKSMDCTASIEAKREALLRAQEHELDLAATARCTVMMIFDETFSSISVEGRPALTRFDMRLEPNEEILIRSIDWLTVNEVTYADAIVQSNAVMRLLLSTGRLHAARILLSHLAYDLLSQASAIASDQATEHVHWRKFFDAQDANVRYHELLASKPGSSSRVDQQKWARALANVVAQSRECDLELLQMDWLKLDLDDEDPDDDLGTERRRDELDRIRHIYVPECVLRLHDMLVQTADVVPDNLGRAVQLSQLVADERHKIYLDFVSRDRNLLTDYLQRVRDASLRLLEKGHDVFTLAAEADDDAE